MIVVTGAKGYIGSVLMNKLPEANGIDIDDWDIRHPTQWNTEVTTVVHLAALVRVGESVQIPQEYYDAAKVDGANAFGRFRHVTFPLLAPATFFVVIISFFNSSQAFIQPYVLTLGGPAEATNLAVFNVYNVAFTHLKLGEASAMAFFIFIIILIVTATLFKFWKTEVEY